jgi:MoxR-like ATPase
MSVAARLVPTFHPGIRVPDPLAAWWLRQVSLRLRREIAWCWHQRGETRAPQDGRLPPPNDPVLDSLDLNRYHEQKQRFFADDVAARYLSEQIAQEPTPSTAGSRFARAAQALQLTGAAQFLLALALAARTDAALGAVCAACQNDLARPYPTLALAQRLWDDPLEIVAAASPQHPLFACGLLTVVASQGASLDWHQALDMPTTVAEALLHPDAALPRAFTLLRPNPAARVGEDSIPENAGALQWLAANEPRRLQIVPLVGVAGCDFAEAAIACSQRQGRAVVQLAEDVACERSGLVPLATAAWLQGLDLLLPEGWVQQAQQHQHTPSEPWFAAIQSLPLRCFVPMTDAAQMQTLPTHVLASSLRLPPLTHAERVDLLRSALGLRGAGLDGAIAEAARRFRLQKKPLERVAASVSVLPKVTQEQLFAACRSQVALQMGAMAQRVDPRFGLRDIVLPAAQSAQLDEIVHAMRALTRVHYEWGTARAWSESGLSVLFCGAPGTGKTMSAEAVAAELELPLFRVDLSQVVNKYIGETEKNLKQIFDAAEASDVVLFFDEADALFGKRTEVKDAHDRFANIEISYLLERMERFKGLAILATNRRKDLDEAFTRRLRYLVEFPMPTAAERARIWRFVFPPGADTSALDFGFLADQFELSGGHIRSIAFNACLQSVGREAADGRGRVEMRTVLIAVRRELEKMGRPAGAGLFGRHAALVGEK